MALIGKKDIFFVAPSFQAIIFYGSNGPVRLGYFFNRSPEFKPLTEIFNSVLVIFVKNPYPVKNFTALNKNILDVFISELIFIIAFFYT